MEYKAVLTAIFNLVGYEPTEAEWEIHLDKTRNKLIGGGVRGGKSMVNSKELHIHWRLDVSARNAILFEQQRALEPALYWLLGDDYESCRGEWEHIAADFQKLGIIQSITKNIDPGEIILQDGTKVVTKSAKYPERVATVAPNGIVICEASQTAYEIYLRAKERLVEKRGWLCMSGTFEEGDFISWYGELYQIGQSYNQIDLKSFSLPSWSNTKIFPGGRNDPEILKAEREMTRERFMERFGGVPCPRTGRVVYNFANVIHVRDCSFNPQLPVEIAVDPGYDGACAVLAIQCYPEHIALIDEIYVQGLVTQEVIEVAKKKEWWGTPADPIVVGGAIDISAKAHQAMPAPISLWSAAGIGLLTKKIAVEDGIDLLNTHLKPHPITGQPGIIVSPKCQGFIAECGGGRSPVEGGGTWMRHKVTQQPINSNNHATKAVIYYLANKFGFKGKRRETKPLKFKRSHPQRKTFVAT